MGLYGETRCGWIPVDFTDFPNLPLIVNAKIKENQLDQIKKEMKWRNRNCDMNKWPKIQKREEK